VSRAGCATVASCLRERKLHVVANSYAGQICESTACRAQLWQAVKRGVPRLLLLQFFHKPDEHHISVTAVKLTILAYDQEVYNEPNA
jgi:hypothetical protein